jgi:hypothetical protein
MHNSSSNTMCVLVLLRMCGRLLIFGVVNGILVIGLVKYLKYLSAFQPLLYQNQCLVLFTL